MAPPLPSLTVAVATIGARMAALRLPPPRAGVDYVVCVQKMAPGSAPDRPAPALELPAPNLPTPDRPASDWPTPDWAARADVRLIPQAGTGVSINRNAGLAAAQGDLVLFSDDDITLDMDGIDRLRGAFAEDPGLALAMGWRAGRLPRRGRRAARHRLTRLNTGRACPPEIMVRRAAIAAADVRFDPDFGVGARYPLGEEYAFVADILRAGGRGLGLPVVTGAHPDISTGDDWRDPVLMAARQALLRRVFGPWAGPVRLVYAWRNRPRFAGTGAALRFALGRA